MSTERGKPKTRRFNGSPLVAPALALIAGLACDRWANPCGTLVWLSASTVFCLAGVVCRGPIGKAFLILAFITLAGAWHHSRRFDLNVDDIGRAKIVDETPAWARGVLIESPMFRKGSGPRERGSTRAVLALTAIHDRGRFQSATGNVALSISGDRTDLRAGDAVEVAGRLSPIEGPLNPGENDPRDYWYAQEIRVRLSVDDATGIVRDPNGRSWRFAGWLGAIREWSRTRLVACLDPQVAPLAAALLLGRREGVDPNVNDAFARTGTMHLLAISGLHMQALAIALRLLGLVLGVDRKQTWTIILVATLAYAFLVGLMPSVVRSAAMTAVICGGELLDLPTRRANLLAAAALVTLLLNPNHLFDVGCQLSFVAVAAIFWGPDFLARICRIDPFLQYLNRRVSPNAIIAPFELNDPLFRLLPTGPARATRRALGMLFEAVWVSSTVWLATAPLTASRFHLISPIGILLNIPLIPLTTLALFAAGAALFLSAIWTPFGVPAGLVCGRLLEWTERLTLWGASLPYGHAFTAAPPAAWVLGFFVAAAAAMLIERNKPNSRNIIAIFLLFYVMIGVWSTVAARKPKTLEADVLAVGHGLAVVIQDMQGRVILYDCGKMGDPHVGRRTIAPALWSRGVRKIDAIVLSHADADHYDALPDLLDRFSIGAVFTPPGFFDEGLNRGIDALRAQIQSRGIPLKTLVDGDRFSIAGGATIDVLHPPEHWLRGTPDNARCIVLDVAGNGHHLLLTGDLEGIGLARLIDRPRPGTIDAMLAPHHGGIKANPTYLYDWAEPRIVIVSQRRPIAGARDALEPIAARGVRVLRTWELGAIQTRFERDGLTVASFVEEQESQTRKLRERVDSMFHSVWFQILFGIIFMLIGLTGSLVLAVREWGAWALVVPGLNAAREGVDWDKTWTLTETRAADGVVLRGYERAAEAGSQCRAVLLMHGMGEGPEALRERAVWLVRQGWDVVLADARGRGRSGGACFSFGAREADDVARWIDKIKGSYQEVDAPVVVWGRSMGAAIAVRAAATTETNSAAGLVLESSYANLRSALKGRLRRSRLPFADLFARAILRRADRLANARVGRPTPLESATKVAAPVLILHGRDDSVVPIEDAKTLARSFRPPAELIEVEGAGHSDVFDKASENQKEQIIIFMNAYLRNAST